MQTPQKLVAIAPQSGQTVQHRAPNHTICGMNSLGSQLSGFQTTMHCVSYFLSRNYWVYTFNSPSLPHVFVCPPSLNNNFGSTMDPNYIAGYVYLDMRALPPYLVNLIDLNADSIVNALFGCNLSGRWIPAIPYAESMERALGCVLIRHSNPYAVESPFLWHFVVPRLFMSRMFAWARGSFGY
jgi:hypothetical protein